MAWLIVRDSLDYVRIKVHNGRYLPFGFQPQNVTMTPNGEIYFHSKCYLSDFFKAHSNLRHWFIHEMAHVWRYKLGCPVVGRGAIRIGLDYDYDYDYELKNTFNITIWRHKLICIDYAIGDATVKQSGELPCFSIRDKRHFWNKTPELSGLTVYDMSVVPLEKVWSFSR